MKTARNANIAAAMFPFRVKRKIQRVASDVWRWQVLDSDGHVLGGGKVGSPTAARAAMDACKRAFVALQDRKRKEFLSGKTS